MQLREIIGGGPALRGRVDGVFRTLEGAAVAMLAAGCAVASPRPAVQESQPPTEPRVTPPSWDQPIDQLLVGFGEDLCVLRGATLSCVDPDRRPLGFRVFQERVARAALAGAWVCWTDDQHVVRCSNRGSKTRDVGIADPKHNLFASRKAVCAWEEDVIRCAAVPAFGNHQRVDLRVPETVGHLLQLSLYDDSEGTSVVGVDAEGSVFVWPDIWATSAVSPTRWNDLPPMKTFERTHDGYVGVTKDGRVIYDEHVIGPDKGPRTLCGVESAQEAHAGMSTICARTDGGVVCASQRYITPQERGRLGPLHEPCEGPRGPLARPDVSQLAMHPFGLTCFAAGGEVYCTGWKDGDRGEPWSPEVPVVHRNAVEIASGTHFNCARLGDGSVRCAGPSHGPLGSTEELAQVKGASRIYAGEHTLCALMAHGDRPGGRLHCFTRGGTVEHRDRGVWEALRPIVVDHEPGTIEVRDSHIAWYATQTRYEYTTTPPFENRAAPWLLEPRPTHAKDRRWHRIQRREEAREGPRVAWAKGKYVLLEDGSFFAVQREPEPNVLGFAFVAITGGIFFPVLDPGPKVRRDLQLHPGTVELAAGHSHVCQRTKSGEVACFGNNAGGQVVARPGDHAHGSSANPKVLELGGRATAIAAGGSHNCALVEGGDVRCWGSWGFRQIRPAATYPPWVRISPPVP